jgi:hypothetical protein
LPPEYLVVPTPLADAPPLPAFLLLAWAPDPPFAPTEEAANDAPLKYVSPPAVLIPPAEPIAYVIEAPLVKVRFVILEYAPPPPPPPA